MKQKHVPACARFGRRAVSGNGDCGSDQLKGDSRFCVVIYIRIWRQNQSFCARYLVMCNLLPLIFCVGSWGTNVAVAAPANLASFPGANGWGAEVDHRLSDSLTQKLATVQASVARVQND